MIAELVDKIIVLICPKFYGYENVIADTLVHHGAKVFLIYENLEWVKLSYRFVYVYLPGFKDRLIQKYYHKQLAGILQDADYFLVIRGSSLTPDIMDYVKENTPERCRFWMYQWDGIKNNESALDILPYFDGISTFDYQDAKTRGWKYRPLFYIPDYLSDSDEKDIDILFLCGLHSNRVKIVNQLKPIAEKNHYRMKIMMQINKSIYYKNKYLDKKPEVIESDRKDVIFQPISIKDSYGLYARSKVVVDYTHPDQTGFTMRTIETLGSKCKLITNNQMVKTADFFDPQNIYVYDEDQVCIPEDFLNSPYKQIDPGIYQSYSLDSWISAMVGNENE